MKPAPNQLCKYTGSGRGNDQIHKVIMASDNEVITVGLPYGCGFTWLGTADEFVQQFKFIQQL
jgi:hypothetical protein